MEMNMGFGMNKLHLNQSFTESFLPSQNMFLLLENGKNITWLKELLKGLEKYILEILWETTSNNIN